MLGILGEVSQKHRSVACLLADKECDRARKPNGAVRKSSHYGRRRWRKKGRWNQAAI